MVEKSTDLSWKHFAPAKELETPDWEAIHQLRKCAMKMEVCGWSVCMDNIYIYMVYYAYFESDYECYHHSSS